MPDLKSTKQLFVNYKKIVFSKKLRHFEGYKNKLLTNKKITSKKATINMKFIVEIISLQHNL